MNCKVSKEKEKHANNVDRALGVQQLATVIFSASKILVYMSLLNKFIYYKMWDDVNDFFTLNDFGIPVLFAAPNYVSVADIVKGTVAKTGFNIFRTYWLFQAIYFAAGDGIDLFFSMIRALIIMLPATLVWTAKSVSDIAIFHYTQRLYTNNGDFTIQPLMIISIINICSGSAALLTVFYYNVMTVFIGKKYIQLCFKNIKILSRILFTVSFIFVLVCIICVVVLWIKVDKSLVSAGFFYVAFASNLVLVIVTLVGLIKPEFYQYVVLRSLGRDVDRFDLQKKDTKEQNSDL